MPQSVDLNSNQLSIVAQTGNIIANVANGAIVRPTGTVPTSGINGFVFDFLGEEEITLESEITDHYTEDNSSIQDHIAQKPIRYVCKGYIGELFNVFPNAILSILTSVQTLDAIPSLQPVFSSQASQVYDQLAAVGDQAVNVIGQAQSLNALISGISTTANRQQNAYTTFLNLWQNRVLCTVETPYQVLYMMAIERVTPVQNENTQIITEFTVSFKQIRLATTLTSTPLTITNAAGSGVKSPSNTAPYNLPSNITLT
jgi:hypothetical protein